jgi:hypothetical protein
VRRGSWELIRLCQLSIHPITIIQSTIEFASDYTLLSLSHQFRIYFQLHSNPTFSFHSIQHISILRNSLHFMSHHSVIISIVLLITIDSDNNNNNTLFSLVSLQSSFFLSLFLSHLIYINVVKGK